MSTDCTEENALKGNEEFVAFLHQHAKRAKVPGSCDKSWLENVWRGKKISLLLHFAEQNGKPDFLAIPTDEFFQQAAESYKG